MKDVSPQILLKPWYSLYSRLKYSSTSKNSRYFELIGHTYYFSPLANNMMSYNSNLIDFKKLAAMYFWYKRASRTDRSILEYFPEYRRCVDMAHKEFNSNYGYYAYAQGGLKRCVNVLLKNTNSRQACFCINNNEAMSENSIDKLCTNTIQFFIKNNTLQMIVQMRSSNFITLLPYDAFMFSVFYFQVYHALRDSKLYYLKVDNIIMQVGSLHFYADDTDNINLEMPKKENLLLNVALDKNWQNKLETELLKYLKK